MYDVENAAFMGILDRGHGPFSELGKLPRWEQLALGRGPLTAKCYDSDTVPRKENRANVPTKPQRIVYLLRFLKPQLNA